MRSRRKWLRGKDSNQRPPGYEPDELPTALPRDEMMLIDNTTRRRLCQAFFILCRTETILTRLRTILFGAFSRSNFRARYCRLRSDIPCGSMQNGRGGKSGSRSPSGLAGTAPRRRAFGLVFRFVLVVFFVACAWLRRPSAKREGLWCGNSRTTMPKSRTCLCQAHAMVPNG